jgi:hypothetical protein
VRRKNVLAEGLGRFAQGAGFDRNALVLADDDGYIVALMKLLAFEPHIGDAKHIAQAVKRRVPPHADHQTLRAIGTLAGKGLFRTNECGLLTDAVDIIVERLGKQGSAEVNRVKGKIRSAPCELALREQLAPVALARCHIAGSRAAGGVSALARSAVA